MLDRFISLNVPYSLSYYFVFLIPIVWVAQLWTVAWTLALQAPLSIRFPRQELQGVAISLSSRSSQPRDGTPVSSIAGKLFTIWATREELTHWKRPWCWEILKAGGERDDRGWDGWMASLTWWTWVWASSGSWWWTGKLACCSSWGCKELEMTERLNWAELIVWVSFYISGVFAVYLGFCRTTQFKAYVSQDIASGSTYPVGIHILIILSLLSVTFLPPHPLFLYVASLLEMSPLAAWDVSSSLPLSYSLSELIF